MIAIPSGNSEDQPSLVLGAGKPVNTSGAAEVPQAALAKSCSTDRGAGCWPGTYSRGGGRARETPSLSSINRG